MWTTPESDTCVDYGKRDGATLRYGGERFYPDGTDGKATTSSWPSSRMRAAKCGLLRRKSYSPVLTVISIWHEAGNSNCERWTWIGFWIAYSRIKESHAVWCNQRNYCGSDCYNIYDVSVPFWSYKASSVSGECGKVMENYTHTKSSWIGLSWRWGKSAHHGSVTSALRSGIVEVADEENIYRKLPLRWKVRFEADIDLRGWANRTVFHLYKNKELQNCQSSSSDAFRLPVVGDERRLSIRQKEYAPSVLSALRGAIIQHGYAGSDQQWLYRIQLTALDNVDPQELISAQFDIPRHRTE